MGQLDEEAVKLLEAAESNKLMWHVSHWLQVACQQLQCLHLMLLYKSDINSCMADRLNKKGKIRISKGVSNQVTQSRGHTIIFLSFTSISLRFIPFK
jgi:hypothetical protein